MFIYKGGTAMTAKVENLCATKKTRSISVDIGERACINCIWYEQHYRPGRGNVSALVPTSMGYCLLKDGARGALRQPCKSYETEARNPETSTTSAS
jgi:hypothetical protein